MFNKDILKPGIIFKTAGKCGTCFKDGCEVDYCKYYRVIDDLMAENYTGHIINLKLYDDNLIHNGNVHLSVADIYKPNEDFDMDLYETYEYLEPIRLPNVYYNHIADDIFINMLKGE